MCKYEEKRLSIKLKKDKRDTEDYLRSEIYHWEFKKRVCPSQTSETTLLRTGVPRTRNTHRHTPNYRREQVSHNDSSVESDFTSDSEIPPSNPSFLYKHRKADRRGRRNADRGDANPNRGHRPWTRSNSRTRSLIFPLRNHLKRRMIPPV